jgi:hypothetical protein
VGNAIRQTGEGTLLKGTVVFGSFPIMDFIESSYNSFTEAGYACEGADRFYIA